MEGSWEHFGGTWERFWINFGVRKASSERFVEILKNNEKHMKNNEKSRFGGLEIREKLEGSLGHLGGSWEPLGASWRLLGASWRISRRYLGDLGGCWTPLTASWSAPGASWRDLGRLLGGSWEYFGGILVLFGSYFGGWEASLKRFVEILENHQKPCKVLQKSRFGGSEIP